MVVLHPGAGLARISGRLVAGDEQNTGAFIEKRLQLGVLGGKRESVDQRVEFCDVAWRVEGGVGFRERGPHSASCEEDHST